MVISSSSSNPIRGATAADSSRNLISDHLPAPLAKFLFFSGLLTNLVVFGLIKCVYDLDIVHFRLIAALILFVLFVKSCFYLRVFRRYLNVLKTRRLESKTRERLLQFFVYIFELPLSLFALFCFTQIYYVKTVSVFYIVFLLIASIYLSFIGIVSVCFIENADVVRFNALKSRKFFHSLNVFSFLFRYFFFVSRSTGLVLFLSTYNDDLTNASADLTDFKLFSFKPDPFLVTLLYSASLLAAFFLAWFVLYGKKALRQGCKSAFFRAVFESYKMLIEYNHAFFQGDRSTYFKCSILSFKTKHQTSCWFGNFLLNFKFNLNNIRVALYMTFQVLVQIAFACYWYFRAILIYNANQNKTTLLSLLTGINTRISLLNLYELEEKIKLRQLALVAICGCFIISMLCFHIYYAYFYKKDVKKASSVVDTKTPPAPNPLAAKGIYQASNGLVVGNPIKKIASSPHLLAYSNPVDASALETMTKSPTTVNLNATSMLSAYVDPIDGFSISTYDQSSEISASPNKSNAKSSRFGDFTSNGRRSSAFQPFRPYAGSNRRFSLSHKCQIFTSDLDVYERSYSSGSSSFVSSDSASFSDEALKYGFRQSQHKMNSDFFHADTETSSGVISTELTDSDMTATSSSSDSSIFSYPHDFNRNNWSAVKNINAKSNFFRDILRSAKPQALPKPQAATWNRNGLESQDSRDKVLGWFRQNPENSNLAAQKNKRASLVPTVPIKMHPGAMPTRMSLQPHSTQHHHIVTGPGGKAIAMSQIPNYYNSSEGSYVI